jgi:hypothetical protein
MKLKVIILLGIIFSFIGGVFYAQTDSFNNTFYIKQIKMLNLTTKTLDKNTKNLIKAKNQADRTIESDNRYNSYHKYYLSVVDKIKKTELNDTEKTRLLEYINGYDKRKQTMLDIMFPDINKPTSEGGYGTMFGSSYANALVELDRNELLTYKMILSNIYSFTHGELIEQIFTE